MNWKIFHSLIGSIMLICLTIYLSIYLNDLHYIPMGSNRADQVPSFRILYQNENRIDFGKWSLLSIAKIACRCTQSTAKHNKYIYVPVKLLDNGRICTDCLLSKYRMSVIMRFKYLYSHFGYQSIERFPSVRIIVAVDIIYLWLSMINWPYNTHD